jgi:ferric-dicitrate binding protein FerR (iron transport regulator)
MNNNYYENIEDFLKDPSFTNWVLQQNQKDFDEWENWLMLHPEKKELVEAAKTIVLGIPFKKDFMTPTEVHLEWEKLNRTLETKKIKQQNNTWYNRRALLGIAASFLLLIAVFYWRSFESQTAAFTYHRAAFGEQIDLKLPDGTEVALNANSVLKYSNHNPRKIWLEGEAFFKVMKKPATNAKFWVHTPDLVIKVLGTQFNVNSHKAQTAVLLEEGKVHLQFNNGQQKDMQVGDLVVFSSKENRILKDIKITKSELHTSWTKGTLIFENTSLEAAMEKIKDTYGLEIIFQNKKTAERNIHVAVPTKNLDICLLALEKALGINIEKNGNKLLIK